MYVWSAARHCKRSVFVYTRLCALWRAVLCGKSLLLAHGVSALIPLATALPHQPHLRVHGVLQSAARRQFTLHSQQVSTLCFNCQSNKLLVANFPICFTSQIHTRTTLLRINMCGVPGVWCVVCGSNGFLKFHAFQPSLFLHVLSANKLAIVLVWHEPHLCTISLSIDCFCFIFSHFRTPNIRWGRFGSYAPVFSSCFW